jgi:hypothetical protein
MVFATLSISLASTLLLTGCGKSKALIAAEEYQAEACTCADAACATAASQRFAARAQDMQTMKVSEARKVSDATAAAAGCVTKVSLANMPKPPQ